MNYYMHCKIEPGYTALTCIYKSSTLAEQSEDKLVTSITRYV